VAFELRREDIRWRGYSSDRPERSSATPIKVGDRMTDEKASRRSAHCSRRILRDVRLEVQGNVLIVASRTAAIGRSNFPG